MGGSQLSQVMASVSKYCLLIQTAWNTAYKLHHRDPAQHATLAEKIEQQANARYGSARLWDDGIIMPQDTRDVVGLGLGLAARAKKGSGTGSPGWDGSSFGVFRM